MILQKQIYGLLTALGLKADASALSAHTGSTSNPHSVTKSQVGLGNADNTSDANKPVSTAQQTALNLKATVVDLNAHADNRSNPHVVTKSQVGLGSVDNTSDTDKPVSTATSSALSTKVDKVAGKGLSTNDFTDVLETKLNGVEAGAQVNDVTSVAGRTGAVVVTKTDVGLSAVTNNAQVKKADSSTTGKIPVWSGVTGDAIVDGYGVENTLVGGAGNVATAAAILAAINDSIGANDAMVFKGVVDCHTNPNYPAANTGDTYKVSVAGKIGGASGPSVEIGDMLICTEDDTASGTHATVGIKWNVIQQNIDGAVVGPATAIDERIAVFDGVSGKLIKDGGKTIAELLGSLTVVQDIANGPSSPSTANSVVNIGDFFSNTPSPAVPVIVSVNGIVIPKGDPDATSNRWINDGLDLEIKVGYSLSTEDEIVANYSKSN